MKILFILIGFFSLGLADEVARVELKSDADAVKSGSASTYPMHRKSADGLSGVIDYGNGRLQKTITFSPADPIVMLVGTYSAPSTVLSGTQCIHIATPNVIVTTDFEPIVEKSESGWKVIFSK